MKKILVLLLLVICGACAQGDSRERGVPLAKVNDRVITDVEFRREAVSYVYYNDIVGMTEEEKQDLLQTIIRKELLIQAAMERNLHQEEQFRRALENFWEQTLITNLLKQEAEQIEGQVLVTEQEIKARYGEMDNGDPNQNLEAAEPAIAEAIREEKKSKALDQWVESLRESAKIEIFQDALKELK